MCDVSYHNTVFRSKECTNRSVHFYCSFLHDVLTKRCDDHRVESVYWVEISFEDFLIIQVMRE